ncbi:hypothetical protein BJ322DRAFT_1070125 [Thelephora terrestris]|uniref:Uncharacterized protein n=1 Tax=Thelephora terrestris TaxID=56493 RepID=A0A9P6HB72_9AGAM|nr:hypothetical protein BJ322DRAFT_1070125 [Thelephora terrestris]
MSITPSPSAHSTGYTTSGYPPTTVSSSSLPMSTPKPKTPKVNVFSNDGSFLGRFHKLKRDELEKEKQAEVLQLKRDFANRFRNRGKRPHPADTTPSSS